MAKREEPNSLVLIDGECNLCNGLVQFIIKRDKAGRFRFAPLQSPVGQRVLREGGMNVSDFDTFVLVESGRLYTRSAAALRIVRKLDGGWPLLYGLTVIPSALRDAVYRIVAKNRYRLFGRKDACLLPTPEVRNRFLEEER
ncbi:thiol-disulfide oxidoreductase DCC family protein [Paenibacillus thailandensis]|uniref:Thiol-disulfide oxidoreductase DCC family protein n=1 Tax=Paenibacillus thailandensis TaxID=393250 RepID=A0ABW5QX50_9BACL